MLKTIWIENLIKVLEYEDKLYKRLLSIAEKKTGIIIDGGIEDLQLLTGKEQRLSGELNQLGDVREQIMNQIEKGLGKNNVALSELISLIPKEQAEKLSKAGERLKETVNKLSGKNSLNQKLIQNALEYVDFSLNLLSQPVPQTTQYGRKGDETSSKAQGVLDIKY